MKSRWHQRVTEHLNIVEIITPALKAAERSTTVHEDSAAADAERKLFCEQWLVSRWHPLQSQVTEKIKQPGACRFLLMLFHCSSQFSVWIQRWNTHWSLSEHTVQSARWNQKTFSRRLFTEALTTSDPSTLASSCPFKSTPVLFMERKRRLSRIAGLNSAETVPSLPRGTRPPPSALAFPSLSPGLWELPLLTIHQDSTAWQLGYPNQRSLIAIFKSN